VHCSPMNIEHANVAATCYWSENDNNVWYYFACNFQSWHSRNHYLYHYSNKYIICSKDITDINYSTIVGYNITYYILHIKRNDIREEIMKWVAIGSYSHCILNVKCICIVSSFIFLHKIILNATIIQCKIFC